MKTLVMVALWILASGSVGGIVCLAGSAVAREVTAWRRERVATEIAAALLSGDRKLNGLEAVTPEVVALLAQQIADALLWQLGRYRYEPTAPGSKPQLKVVP